MMGQSNQEMDVDDERWRIGNGHIELKVLVLDSIEHITKGSWQPQIFVTLSCMNRAYEGRFLLGLQQTWPVSSYLLFFFFTYTYAWHTPTYI